MDSLEAPEASIAGVDDAHPVLLDTSLRRIDVGFPLVETAVRLRAKHYRRGRSPLSLADCICVASAGSDGAVATADEAMLAMADAEGIRSVRLT